MPDALKEAIQAGSLEAVQAAIDTDPKAARHPKYMGAAAGAAFLPAVQVLHRNGGDMNGLYRNYRPLHALLQTDPHKAAGKPEPARVKCLQWMLKHGADPEQMGAWPQARAIIIAAFVGQPEYVQALRDAGARIDGFVSAALGDVKAVKKALAADAGFANARDGGVMTALQCACGSRMKNAKTLEVAELLIDAGADIAAATQSWGHPVDAVYFAASSKSKQLFTLLLERGADATHALVPAVWNANLEFAEIALEHGAEPDRAVADRKMPLLNHLICWGQIPSTLWLLDHGASPNVPDTRGWTAVHQAASRGNARMMKAVLDAGGDVKRKDKEGSTPLDIAADCRRDKLMPMMQAAV